jgi:mono/diheme cytochrome c family protein
MQKAVASVLVVLTGLVGIALANQGDGSKWAAPADARAKANPVPSSPEVLAQGQALYQKNCLMCHGPTGKGDGPATEFVKPPPANISSAKKQADLTDGEIFWKLTHGRNPMPPFGKKLSDEERWALVHYVRSLKVDS